MAVGGRAGYGRVVKGGFGAMEAMRRHIWLAQRLHVPGAVQA